jgi:lysophospholipid acyltransferase (LPLAT)-like uncharacterized protein
MKRLFRSAFAQSLLGFLAAAYIELMISTLRWEYEGKDAVDAVMSGEEGLLVLFWHGRIAQGMACRNLMRQKPRRVFISLSADAEFIAKAAERVRIPPIRGSAARAGADRSKGGAQAFRQALSFLRSGGVMITTPDGPRGPAEVMPLGAPTLARTAGCPIFLMSLAARPSLRLNSWDQARIPLPFARAAAFFDGPIPPPPRGASPEALEAVRADWEARLRQGQARVEARLAA